MSLRNVKRVSNNKSKHYLRSNKMTTNLEKQFFDTFGIEPIIYCSKPILDCDAKKSVTCTKDCEYYSGILYPQITDRILLELICILTRWHLDEREPYEIMSINIEQLKNQILSNSLYIAKYAKAKKRVQSLFKEG